MLCVIKGILFVEGVGDLFTDNISEVQIKTKRQLLFPRSYCHALKSFKHKVFSHSNSFSEGFDGCSGCFGLHVLNSFMLISAAFGPF